MHHYSLKFIFVTVLINLFVPGTLLANDEAWQSLRDGKAVAIMRHAIAPFDVDNSGLTRDACKEERNLSQEGRDQAVKIGDLFRANGVMQPKVYSSKLCRCIDTAILLGFDAPTVLPLITSYYLQQDVDGSAQTEDLKKWIKNQTTQASATNILVTHGVNIKDLLGESGYASQGEILILSIENNEVVVLLRVSADPY